MSQPEKNNGRVPQPGRRARMSQEERRAQNLDRLQQYGSQVIVPRAPETRVMIRMVYPLNKALTKLRRLIGMPLSIAAVMKAIEPIQLWLTDVRAWLVQSGGEFIMTSTVLGNEPAQRMRLAQHPDAHVIIPQTDETRLVVEALIRMDQVLLMLRMVSLESIQQDGRLKQALELVQGLNAAVGQVCQSAQIDYQEPKGLRRPEEESKGSPASGVGQSSTHAAVA